MAERKTACGYYHQNSCANCRHCIHYYAICQKHRFPINRDHGMCDDFAMIGGGRETARPESAPYRRRKTITKRMK